METVAAPNAVSTRLEEEATRYAKIRKAIEVKEREPGEIFGIEREAQVAEREERLDEG
ncbi:MAG: hypothetical protein JG766_304 [Desulfacinum sp.]|jgi:hypothetical protein|nr:hypothetical protein [Desulfacinum sp.]